MRRDRPTFILLVLLATIGTVSAAETSGRPPRGPLKRTNPNIYDVSVQVALRTSINRTDALGRRSYNLVDAPIVMPVIFRNTYSRVESDSLRGRLWLSGREDTSLPQRTRLDEGYPFGTTLAIMPVQSYSGHELRWTFEFRTQVWSSVIDDAAAATIPWPREWPDDVQDGLRPQKFIESDKPIFKQAVEDASQGQLRLVPPYLAAKDLIRYCIQHVTVNGDGVHMGVNHTLQALEMKGALKTVEDGEGGPHDLVCVCIATLRAAGIPARPVIGFRMGRKLSPYGREPGQSNDAYKSEVLSWGEFYLPEAGWVPFDPMQLRGNGAMHRDVRDPWIDFGTMTQLNTRIPLAFHFIPPTTVQSPFGPAIWGWDPRPGGDPSTEPVLDFSHVDRGAGKEVVE